MADGKIDPFDVAALEKSLNDSATRVSAIWVSYLAFGLYLVAATVNVSQRQLFIADAMKLPVLGIDLPLVGFFLFAPILFVMLHVYVLLQLLLLARTALAYNEAVEHTVAEATDRARIRQRLANTLFAQLLAGSPREREGALGAALAVMAWVTLAIAPLLVLLSFEIRFLAYHSSPVTWVHRLLIAVDLLAILLVWPAVLDPRRDVHIRGLLRNRIILAAAVCLLLFSLIVPTFPGEPQAFLTRFGKRDHAHVVVPECDARSWFEWLMPASFDRFWITGEDLIEDDKIARAERARKGRRQFALQAEQSRSFNGRNLSCGWFVGTGLRYADFSSANLRGAQFSAADLEGASFVGAELLGADFSGARLPRARLIHAKLRQANLYAVQAQAVEGGAAQFHGANLSFAQLQGADLFQAQLQGVSLMNARLDGASLRRAELQGAKLQRTELRGADLESSGLEGVDLSDARLEGASLFKARLQGADLHGARLHLADLSRASLWRTTGLACARAQIIDPRLQPRIANRLAALDEAQVDATAEAIATFVDQVVDVLPAAIRTKMRADLGARLSGPTGANSTPAPPQSLDCRTEPLPDIRYKSELTTTLTDLACNLGSNRKHVAERLHIAWIGSMLYSNLEQALAGGLLAADEGSCLGAKQLDDETKEALRAIVAKRDFK